MYRISLVFIERKPLVVYLFAFIRDQTHSFTIIYIGFFSRENDNIYSYFEFVSIEFTCKLHIFKIPFRHLLILRLFQHNEIGF